MTDRRRERPAPETIGWREWVRFPDLVPEAVKAKVDTGARTSALHAFRIRGFERDGAEWVRFEVHPVQRSSRGSRVVEAPVVEHRRVRSSNGEVESRPVIRTTVELGGQSWPILVTLTTRDEMGFRVLLGRSAIRRRFVVDVARSFAAVVPDAAQ
ncbi:MAG: ATP-dependent zinc protease [Acidimicrobiales bacterium]